MGHVVRVVGCRGFVDVDQPIVVVYIEGVVEVGIGVEFTLIGGKAEGVGVIRRRRRVRGSGSGYFWGLFPPLKLFCPKPVYQV